MHKEFNVIRLLYDGKMTGLVNRSSPEKTVAIIQARMNSTRLPGKVMRELCGKSVLAHIISRVKKCPYIDEFVVATPDSCENDVIEREAQQHHVSCFRGSEEDVLSRFYWAAKQYKADIVVRLTADCPLVDPFLLTELMNTFFTLQKTKQIDYLSNAALKRSYPRGLDLEIFTFNTLQTAFINATNAYDKEHVTPYIYSHPEIFSLYNHELGLDYSTYRWTLDTQEDWKFILQVYQNLYQQNNMFTYQDVLKLLDNNPELIHLDTFATATSKHFPNCKSL